MVIFHSFLYVYQRVIPQLPLWLPPFSSHQASGNQRGDLKKQTASLAHRHSSFPDQSWKKKIQEKKRGNRLSRRPGAWTQRANCPPWKSLKNARICFVFHHQNEQNNILLMRKYMFLICFDYIRKKKGMCVDVTHHSQRGLKAAFLTSATSRREVLVRSNSRSRSIVHMLA